MEYKIDKYGNKYWYNEKAKYHREDGPAIDEWENVSKYWYLNDNWYKEYLYNIIIYLRNSNGILK